MTTVDDFATTEELAAKQQSLQDAKQAIAGPVPLIPEAPDTSLVLPLGLLIDETRQTQVKVRELTGSDEEALARMREPNEYFDLVIALGTVSIGDFDLSSLPPAERQGRLRSLLIGERDQLFMAVIKATFGNTKTINFTCRSCGESQEVDLLLSEDFKPLDVGVISTTTHTFTTTKGDTLDYRLVTGEDQREALARKGSSIAEQNSIILSRCITRVNSGLLPDPLGFVRGLSIKDRNDLLGALVSKQPSIDLEVTTTCVACSTSQTLPLGWGDLFRS